MTKILNPTSWNMEEKDWIERPPEADDLGVGNLFGDPDPFDTFTYSVGEKTFTLKGYKAENGQILASTGLTLWRASPLLCDYMVKEEHQLRGRTVIELGSGLGLCGIVAHHLGARRVVLTDGDTNTLKLLRENVASNAAAKSMECRQLRWGIDTLAEKFDIVLGSDVVYVEEVIEPLLTTAVALMTNPGGAFWLSYARRNVSIDKVLASAKRHGLSWTEPREAEGVYVFVKESV